jgi:hypothetical protein
MLLAFTSTVIPGFLSAYSFNLKMEVTCSSEMLVDFQWDTERYIPKDRIFQGH